MNDCDDSVMIVAATAAVAVTAADVTACALSTRWLAAIMFALAQL